MFTFKKSKPDISYWYTPTLMSRLTKEEEDSAEDEDVAEDFGSALLEIAEDFARENGRKTIKVHLGDKTTYFESRAFYPKHGYKFVDDDHIEKAL